MLTLTPLTLTFWMPENEYEFAICGSNAPSASEAPTLPGDSKGAGVGAINEVIPLTATSVTTALAIPPTTGIALTTVAAVPTAPATVPTAPIAVDAIPPTTGIAEAAEATTAAPEEIAPKTAPTAGNDSVAILII